MADVNLKFYQQMVNKGIISKYQKEKAHDGKIDTDAESNNFNDTAADKNFDINNDGLTDEKDIAVMKETYNQMIDYLATLSKNAANIKTVSINVNAGKGITEKTKLLFNEEGDLQTYQDGYTYYLNGKEKGYTQHNVGDGTKKVVDNFIYNEDNRAVKWDENVFADEVTTEYTQHKQEITWAEDKFHAATRLDQIINISTGEITQINVSKLNDDKVTTSSQTYNAETLKDTFFNEWTTDTTLESKSSNFTYQINFLDLTAKLSGFNSNTTVYNIYSEDSVVHASNDMGKNVNIYDNTGALQNTVVNNLAESYPVLSGNKIKLSDSETITLLNGENVIIDDDNTVKITASDGKLSSMSKTNGETSVTLTYDEILNSLSYTTKHYTNLYSTVTSITDRLLKDVVIKNLAEEIALAINSDKNSDEYKNSYNTTIKNDLIKTEDNMKNIIGEIVEKDDGLYVNDGENLVKLGISAETYLELFPPVERYDINQQNIGDCYFISGCLLDMLKNPKAFTKLIQMFSENNEGDICVSFKGTFKDYSPVTFEDGNLQVVDGYVHDSYVGAKNWISGSKGIQMLEQAYAISKFAKTSGEEINTIDVDATIDAITSGFQLYVYSEVLDIEYGLDYKQGNDVKDCYNITTEDGKYIHFNYTSYNMDIGSYFDEIANDVNSGNNLYSLLSFSSGNNTYNMVSSHAYSIEKIDATNNIVYITNPWYGGIAIAVPYDVFDDIYKFQINIGYLDT